MTNSSRNLRAIAAALLIVAAGCGPDQSSGGGDGSGGGDVVNPPVGGGTFDPSFGTSGISMTGVGSNGMFLAVATQADGKIVAAGNYSVGDLGRFLVMRFNADGTKDGSFGTGGKADVTFGTEFESATALVVQADGKIVTAGYIYNGATFSMAVARFKSDGSADDDFDVDGKVTQSVGTSHSFAYGATQQFDGKIIVVGSSIPPQSQSSDVTVLRFDANGALDSTFGGDGIVTTSSGSGPASPDEAHVVVVQPDGKIVVGGSTSSDYFHTGFGLVRYQDDGTLDTTFGWGGIASTQFYEGGGGGIASMALQPDGKILVAGTLLTLAGGGDLAVARYTVDGALDPAFRGGGIWVTGLLNVPDSASALALQPDGRIVVTGSLAGVPAVARLDSDGSYDSAFGNEGWFTLPGHYGAFMGTVVQPDGRIVVAGGADGDAMLLRLR